MFMIMIMIMIMIKIIVKYQPINERNINYINHKRYLFDANIHVKGRWYGKAIKSICGTQLYDDTENDNDNDKYQVNDYVHNGDVDKDNDNVDDDNYYVDNVNDNVNDKDDYDKCNS